MEKLTDTMARIKQEVSLRAWCEDHLEPMGKTFVCPACGSGTGRNHTPAFSIYTDGLRWKCFVCDKGGDIFDLAGIVEGTDDKTAQLEAVATWAGLEGRKKVKKTSRNPTTKPVLVADHSEGREKHRAYIEAMKANIDDPAAVAYLASRGISLDQAKAWGFGYDPNHPQEWQDAAGEWHKSGRLVIPFPDPRGAYYHIDRAIDDRADNAKYVKPKSEEVGEQPLYNPAALKTPTFFVCEGVLDALAVKACGYEATALCGTAGRQLVTAMSGLKNAGYPLLMLDNDKPKEDGRRPGEEAQKKIADELYKAGIECDCAFTNDLKAKDAAELYAADPAALKRYLAFRCDSALTSLERKREEAYRATLQRLHVVDAAGISNNICDVSNLVEPIPTGFRNLDKALGGGLQPQNVYVLGGMTSIGKTTLTHQIADQMAAAANHVLFVSVEQRAPELIAKSLSRILYTVPDIEGRTHKATAQQLTVKDQRLKWNAADLENELYLAQAQSYYQRGIAPYIHYVEAQNQPTVADVRTIVEVMADRTGKPPIVFIDYLQLLGAPEGHDREDEKSLLKRNMVALRQLAGDCDTPVFVLAALSRTGGLKSIETDSFRDSSNIEYSSDVLLGLQLRGLKSRLEGMGDKGEEQKRQAAARWIDEEKRKETMELETIIVKSRGLGLTGEPIRLNFTAAYNTFKEV